MRNAESLFNEARLISYAIYNIAAVNITMIAIQYVVNTIYIIIDETRVPRTKRMYHIKRHIARSLFIFPRAGPDIKYLLGFLRTQLSTSVTVFLVFGPKVRQLRRTDEIIMDIEKNQYFNFRIAENCLVPISLARIGLFNVYPFYSFPFYSSLIM